MPSPATATATVITPETLAAKRYSFKEAADAAGVDLSSVWRWAQNGVRGVKLPSIRLGNRQFVLERDLLEFLNATNAQPARMRSDRHARIQRRRRAA